MINREPPIGGRVSVQILKIVEHFFTSILLTTNSKRHGSH